MIDPAVKVAMAVCILIAGTCAAMMFRHASKLATAPVAHPAEQDGGGKRLLIPRSVGANGAATVGPGKRTAPSSIPLPSNDGSPHTSTVLVPSDPGESPPPLAERYPKPAHSASWGVSMSTLMPVPVPADDAARTHTVVDGDTLASLAERFLGSTNRAKEILAANRDVLTDARLLPIGTELKIPPRSKRAAQPPVRP
jgi:nucleoid-associated protein YgaU